MIIIIACVCAMDLLKMDNNNNWTNNKYHIIFTTLKSIEIEKK